MLDNLISAFSIKDTETQKNTTLNLQNGQYT